MKKKIIGLICMFLIVIMPFNVALVDPSFSEFDSEEDEYDTGESILLNVKEYEPVMVTSNLLEDNNVPVYVFLSALSIGELFQGTNLEPVYGGFEIDKIHVKPADVGTQDLLAGQPKYIKPEKFTSENAGYVYMTLDQIELEEDMPDEINMTFNAEIWFSEVTRIFELAETSLVLPTDGDYDAWEEKLDSEGSAYTFFGNRGLIRVTSIEGNTAFLTVYSNKDLYWPIMGAPRAIADLELKEGETSRYIDLGETDEIAMGMAKFRVKLDDLRDPQQEKALFTVIVDGNSQNTILSKGMSLYPGSTWKVETMSTSVTDEGYAYTVVLKGSRGDRKTLTSTIGLTQQSASEELNIVFYEKNKEGQIAGLFYDSTTRTITSGHISELSSKFREYSVNVDTSEVENSAAQTNKVRIEEGMTLKEVMYNVLPSGHYFIVDGKKLVIKEFSESDPCTSVDLLDNSKTVTVTGHQNDIDFERSLICTSIAEYKEVIDNYPGISDPGGYLYEDSAKLAIAYSYYEDLRLTYSVDDQEYKACVKQAVDILEEVESGSSLYASAQGMIQDYQEQISSNAVYDAVSLEDNGRDIYVELKEVQQLSEAHKPSATMQKDGNTKTYLLGDKLFSSDQQEEYNQNTVDYNWQITGISDDRVTLTKYFTSTVKGRVLTKTVSLGENEIIGSSELRLMSVDPKKEAYLTVIPGTGKSLVSRTNFSVHIPIEKRAIQLTPDQIDSRIEKAKKLQESLEKNIAVLDKILRTWNKICYGVFAFIELKLLFSTPSASSRHDVIRGVDDNGGWYTWCQERSGYNQEYTSVDQCMMQNSAAIQEDINSAKASKQAVEDDPTLYESQGWYENAVEGYGGDDALDECREILGDEVFMDEETLQEMAYLNQLNENTVSRGSGYDLKEEVGSYANSQGIVDTSEGYFKQRQEGCSALNTALDGLPADTADRDKTTAAWAAYESGVSTHLQSTGSLETPVVDDYPGSGINELVKSGAVNIINVGNTVATGTDEYYIYMGGQQIPVRPLTYTAIDQLELFTKLDPSVDLGDQQERIDDSDKFGDKKNDIVTTREGMQLFYPASITKSNVQDIEIYAANPAYLSGELNDDYADSPSFVIYGSGEYMGFPYCLPYTRSPGNFIKIIEYSKANDIQTMQYWNVGPDGDLCTDDDVLVRHESQLDLEDVYGSGGFPSRNQLYSWANKYLKKDWVDGKQYSFPGSNKQFKAKYVKAGAVYEGTTESCFDVMDPNDCKLMFNVCDPVMCPPSRFNLNGRWQVDNVVESGIIGSVMLGWGNGDVLPICFTGIQASLHYWKSMLDAYVECLEASKFEGKTVGVCDKMRSVYICEILVNEAAAIFDSKGGILGFMGEKFYGSRDDISGGEYLKFEENLQNTQDAFTYFTTEYSTTAFGAFKGRSFKEIGTSICKQAIFGKMPIFDDFMGKLSEPEDPTQFFASVTVKPHSDTAGTSAYQTYYHIYAGNNPNIERIVYSVQLYNSITQQVHYVTEECGGVSKTIANGEMADATMDCIAPSGFDQVCVVINGDRTCGFGQVTTMFSSNYVKDMLVADEALRNISSEEECYPSYPTASPTVSQVGSFGTTDNLYTPYDYGIFNDGIRRVCSLENPAMGQGNTDSWKMVGSCGQDADGRSLGSCWMDMDTVTIKDTERSEQVTAYWEENDIRNRAIAAGIDNLLEGTESQDELDKIEDNSFGDCDTIVKLPPEIEDFLSRTLEFEHAAYAQLKMGDIYTSMLGQCHIEGSRPVDVVLSIGPSANNLYGASVSSLYPTEVDAGEYVEFQIKNVNQNNINVDSSITLDCEYDSGESTQSCSFIVPDNVDEFDVTVTVYNDARTETLFDKTFSFTTSELSPIGTPAISIDCNLCGQGVSICSKDECYDYGKTCYYKRGYNNCHNCADEIDSCSDLNKHPERCGNNECAEAAGLDCQWDFDEEECVGGAALSTAGLPSSGFCGEKLVAIAEQAINDGGHPYCLTATIWPPESSPPTNCKIENNIIYGPDGEPARDYGQTQTCRDRLNSLGGGVRCPIDCSSFTKWVYERYAVVYGDQQFVDLLGSMQRSATWQANNVGVSVDGTPDCATRGYSPDPWVKSTCEPQTPKYENLEPGDLIIMCDTNNFNNNNITTCLDDGVTHVGMYVGDEMMIDAGNPVQKRRVDTFKYVGAKRLCNT